MKKLLFLPLFLLTGILTAVAQDTIRCTDGTEIQARVLEITHEQIRYKRFSNPDGPTYVLPTARIREIVYPNGEQDRFDRTEQPAVPESGSQGSEAKEAVGSLSGDVVGRSYAVGDYYEDGTVRGVVCDVWDDGRHGLILSLEEADLSWSTFRAPHLRALEVTTNADGAENMRAVERYIVQNGLSWNDFPAFAWCRAQGEGWYLPAIDELLRVCANYNGGGRISNDRQARNRFNNALRMNGGKRMDRLAYYFSSTEQNAKTALCTHTSLEPPYVEPIPKYTRFFVRAVRKF